MGRSRNSKPKPKPVVTSEPWLKANDELVATGNVIIINGRSVHIGASPYMRWKATGQITDTQDRAIGHCLRLWSLTGVPEAQTTAGYGERTGGGQQAEPEWLSVKRIDAKHDLARVEGYFNGLRSYWDVFENCIRYDEPGGTAGSRIMGWSATRANASALTTVQFVADIICERERL